MKIKKLIIAAIFFASPYMVSNYLVFVFLVPVLCLLYSKKEIKNTHLMLFSFAVTFIVLLPVITYDAGTYLFGVLLSSFFITAFLLISKILIKRLRHNIFSIFIPGIVWVLLIYLMNVKSLMASAFDIGVLFPVSAPLIWYTGSIGLTLLIVLFNSSIARFLIKKDKPSLMVASSLLAVFLFSIVFSLTQNPDGLIDPGSSRKVALIQGDIPGKSWSGFKENLDDRIERYIDLSEKAGKEEVDLIVWPEYTLPVDLMNRFPAKMKPIISEIKKSGTVHVIGSMLTDKSDKDRNYNTALIFGRNGSVEDIYYSRDPAIFNRNVIPAKKGEKLFLGKTGITLCWEEINERVFRDYSKLGAEYFISMSSNTDLDYSWFKRYVSFFSRARAAENMRYLARASQTGVTQIIDPFGRIVKKVPPDRSTYLTGKVYGVSKKTFYSQFGDIITKIFVFSLIVIILIGEVNIRNRRGAAFKFITWLVIFVFLFDQVALAGDRVFYRYNYSVVKNLLSDGIEQDKSGHMAPAFLSRAQRKHENILRSKNIINEEMHYFLDKRSRKRQEEKPVLLKKKKSFIMAPAKRIQYTLSDYDRTGSPQQISVYTYSADGKTLKKIVSYDIRDLSSSQWINDELEKVSEEGDPTVQGSF
ncbi:MAG: nitrilase-related carbon-nitrogen hydrolase, partial [Candidatus Omnitrophota bacterium]